MQVLATMDCSFPIFIGSIIFSQYIDEYGDVCVYIKGRGRGRARMCVGYAHWRYT